MPKARIAVPAFLTALAVPVLALAGCSARSAHHFSEPPPPPPATPAANPFQHRVTGRGFTIALAGENDVPAAGGHSSAAAAVTIHRANDRVCWTVTRLTGVPAPLYAYIHRGSAGAAGPVVIPLGARYAPAGCVTGVAPALLVQIEAHPRGYYLAIHNRQYPAGAVRGQL